MADAERIVFLYEEPRVPDLIVETFTAQVPNGFALDFCPLHTPDDRRRALVAKAGYLVAYGGAFNDFDVAGSVKLFQVLSAGFDRLDMGAFKEAGIPVANNGGANAPTVAEHAVMLMLSVFRKLPLHHAALANGDWLGHKNVLNMRELHGKQVGIVGFGRIGREVARIVNGFLAKPVYFDVRPPSEEVEKELSASRLSLDDLLATSDVVSVHTPLNDATRKLMNRDAFARMKASAIYVTTARGAVTDEAALIEALDNGAIAGAGVDVFEREPTVADNALFNRDNVVVTPHIAGSTLDTWYRRIEFAFSNIQRVAGGKEPLARVG